MYNAKQAFVRSDDRYAIGDRDKLTWNADESLDIYLQADSPPITKKWNGCPLRTRASNLILRLYWPKESVLNGSWRPPAITESADAGGSHMRGQYGFRVESRCRCPRPSGDSAGHGHLLASIRVYPPCAAADQGSPVPGSSLPLCLHDAIRDSQYSAHAISFSLIVSSRQAPSASRRLMDQSIDHCQLSRGSSPSACS